MLVFPNYAKNYVSTIDNGLLSLWSTGLHLGSSCLVNSPPKKHVDGWERLGPNQTNMADQVTCFSDFLVLCSFHAVKLQHLIPVGKISALMYQGTNEETTISMRRGSDNTVEKDVHCS